MASTARSLLRTSNGTLAASMAALFALTSSCTDDCDHRPVSRCAWFSSLPRPLRQNDPIWTLSRSQLRSREHDEARAQNILAEVQQHIRRLQNSLTDQDEANSRSRLGSLQADWLQTVYGKGGATLQDRQAFLEEYGCTGYTNEVLDCILKHKMTGIVELGAGNGQWARALSDRYNESTRSANASYQVVLAFDDMSQLPLNPKIYHDKTQPAHDYFGLVRPLLGDASDPAKAIDYTLQQWTCRGRALLLVYPPPSSDMAVQCARSYASLPQESHTIIYVGEGRGGATANDAFFDYMESSGWMILQVLDVKRFGTKGLERMYVLQKIRAHQRD